jgi:hypothetical protein
MVSRVVTGERKRIIALLQKTLPRVAEQRLNDLLDADEGMYRISALKREQTRPCGRARAAAACRCATRQLLDENLGKHG